MDNPTVVLGGTGKTGRRVVTRLRRRGVPVRAGSRLQRPPFDWRDSRTWAPVLHGASAAYIAYAPDVAAPDAADTIGAAARQAVAAGAGRLVLLSGRGEEECLPAEQAVADAGAAWTIVRASWFYQNFSEAFLLQPVLGDGVAVPPADVLEPFADAGDLADVVVAALTEDGHAGRVYEITGPRLLTFHEVIGAIARATGRDIGLTHVSTAVFADALARQAVSDERAVRFLAGLFTKALDGRNSHVTDDVQRVLGRPATDFTAYAEATAATGVWTPAR